MTGQHHHLDDDRLYDAYYLGRAGEALDPPMAEHLTDCATCRTRFHELTRGLDVLRDEADDEIDLLFPAERLRAQREQIAQRLEAVGRVAQVISFPGRLVGRHLTGTTPSRIGPMWTSAAAAAGLLVGVALGMFMDQSRSDSIAQPRPAAAALPVPVAEAIPRATAADYDAFLYELDEVRRGPRTPELRPLDAMTPHVQDISTRLH